jgi:hypothetical protein
MVVTTLMTIYSTLDGDENKPGYNCKAARDLGVAQNANIRSPRVQAIWNRLALVNKTVNYPERRKISSRFCLRVYCGNNVLPQRAVLLYSRTFTCNTVSLNWRKQCPFTPSVAEFALFLLVSNWLALFQIFSHWSALC